MEIIIIKLTLPLGLFLVFFVIPEIFQSKYKIPIMQNLFIGFGGFLIGIFISFS